MVYVSECEYLCAGMHTCVSVGGKERVFLKVVLEKKF